LERVVEIPEGLVAELEALRRRVAELEKLEAEQRQTEEQLIIADRLASVGELASGLAHELNNPLTSVIGFAQLLLGRELPEEIREDIGVIYSEARRAAEVMKNLLIFARKHSPVKQLVDINSVIGKVLELRAYEHKVENIQVVTRLAADLPLTLADYFQLQQVFLNIVINAEHFMLESHQRGTLVITTRRIGQTIMVSFADDGPGISRENLGRLFDPFFTTKEVGQGTGLGLSICHGIVTGHGGRIYAESASGRGATFFMELPVLADTSG
jgi:signal transduction histidine kinase